jgi:hypothetical protein
MPVEAIVCGGLPQAGWAEAMLRDIATALSGIGVPAHYVAIGASSDVDLDGLVADRTRRSVPLFLLSLNGKAPPTPVPRFDFMVDHPLQHARRVASASPHAAFGVVDSRHTDFGRYRLPAKAPVVFFPHGGPPPEPDPPAMAERDIDVLFAGDIRIQPQRASWVQALRAPTALGAAFLEAADQAIAEGADGHDALAEACARQGIDPTEVPFDVWARAVDMVEACAQAYVRHATLAGARGLRVHVAGRVPRHLFAGAASDLVFLGPQEFPDVLALMSRAKFVLNVTPKFLHGAHERVWYAMARGANVVTSESRFLDRYFKQGESIVYMARGDPAFGDRVAPLMGNPSALRDMADAARHLYAAGHTWRHRVSVLPALMRRLVRAAGYGE